MHHPRMLRDKSRRSVPRSVLFLSTRWRFFAPVAAGGFKSVRRFRLVACGLGSRFRISWDHLAKRGGSWAGFMALCLFL